MYDKMKVTLHEYQYTSLLFIVQFFLEREVFQSKWCFYLATAFDVSNYG